MRPVSVDTCTEVHFKTCSIWQLRLNHNFRIETVACNYVPSLELLATCPCAKYRTARYVTWNYYAVEYRSLEQTLHRATHVCLFVWTDMTTNRDEGRHLFCCYLTTLLLTGWAGRLLPRYLFLTPCPALFLRPTNEAYSEHNPRVTLCSLLKPFMEITSKRKRSKEHAAYMGNWRVHTE